MTSLLGEEQDPEYQDPDHYEIEEEIGRGGDGIVYRCRDKNVGRLVAIKFVSFLRTSDETARQRFRSEIETIASLDHPHIIPVYANGEMDGRSFYTMKYLGGGSLSSHHENPLPPGQAVALMQKITDAVSHAHERGVLHRDLKPSNVLLDDRGEPCLSDFGLAKRHTTESQLTITGSVMGTPAYMSPEQARGENTTLTPASDIFSLGSLFYFLLTGQHAFHGDDSHVILRRVIEDEPSFSDLDRDLIAVCRKCLEKNPDHRYPSARSLSQDLQRWQQNEPVTARHLTLTRRTGRIIRRHATSLIIASLGILALGLWLRPDSPKPSAAPSTLLENEADYLARLDQSLVKLRQLDFQEANRLLDRAHPSHRDLEWQVAKALARGDELWQVNHAELQPSELFLSGEKVILKSQQGTFFLVSSQDGSLESIKEVPKADLLYSPDGSWQATFSDNSAQVFRQGDDIATFTFDGFKKPIGTVQFSRDSSYLIISARDQKSYLQVRDLNSGKITLNQGTSQSAQTTPNFDHSAMTLFGDFPYFITWDYTARNNLRQFGLFPDKPHFRRDTYRNDGSYFFGIFKSTSHLVNLPDGSGSLSLHPDGTLRRWPPVRNLPGIDDALAIDVEEGPPAISHNGRYALFQNFHQQPEIHDFERSTSFLLPFNQAPVIVLNDGTFITVVEETGQLITRKFDGIEESVWLWNADTDLPGQASQRVIGTTVTPDEKTAVALFASGFLKIDLQRNSASFTATHDIASSIALSPDGQRVAVVINDTLVYEGDNIITLKATEHQHRYCHFRTNDELLVSDNDGALHHYHTKEGTLTKTSELERITALTTSPDGRFILTGGNERIILWRDSQKRLEIPTDSSPFWLQLCDNNRILVHLNQMGTIERIILKTP